MNEQPRHIYGPVVIEKRRQHDGSFKFEIWDNHWFHFHRIDTFDTKVKAEAVVKKLRDEIARR